MHQRKTEVSLLEEFTAALNKIHAAIAQLVLWRIWRFAFTRYDTAGQLQRATRELRYLISQTPRPVQLTLIAYLTHKNNEVERRHRLKHRKRIPAFSLMHFSVTR